ncbi:aromatase/cyclase [Nocardia sp. NPDC057353]|uniref:aromatase/cyclase n=1 Tax=Nocardia sp. NPDC057353 TaxID=3346104 RepID=UPI003638EA45
MTQGECTRDVRHALVTEAARADLFALVADVTRWPVVLEPCVYTKYVRREADRELFLIWAVTNDEVKSWKSQRSVRPETGEIDFRQLRSQPPVTSMSGQWAFAELPDGRTEISLSHRFSADTVTDLDWIEAAVDRNTKAELATLSRFASFGHTIDELLFSFSDTVRFTGEAMAVYEFLAAADRWPELLPHVARTVVDETDGGIQRLTMDTVTADGGTHTTQSIRLCFPGERIVYKQTTLPGFLLGHSGEWELTEGPDGQVLTATHTVALDPTAIGAAFGAGTTLAEARSRVRELLGANSRATMAHAVAAVAHRSTT